MKRIIYSGLLLALLYAPARSFAQDSLSKKPVFKLGAFFISDLQYYGRRDSLKSSGFFPLAELWFNNKFYVNAAPVFVNNSVAGSRYEGTVFTTGYQQRNVHSSKHIYVAVPLYKSNSGLVQSALKVQGAANFSWLNKIINLTGGVDVKYSNRLDYGATAGVDHIFKKQLTPNSALIIDPSAYLYAGSQNFSETYYQKKNFLLFQGPSEKQTKNSSRFSILSYEFSAPVIYAKKNWLLLVTPSYVIPQNLVTVANHPELSEQGKELFYITAGAKFSF